MINYFFIKLQIQALTLSILAEFNNWKIQEITDISIKALQNLKRKTRSCRFNSEWDSWILKKYVKNEKQTDCWKKIISEMKQSIIQSATKNRSEWEKFSEILTFEADISHFSVCQILKRYRFRIVKLFWKSELIKSVRQTCLAFVKRFAHWILNDWKKIIWMNEISVILEHRREAVCV